VGVAMEVLAGEPNWGLVLPSLGRENGFPLLVLHDLSESDSRIRYRSSPSAGQGPLGLDRRPVWNTVCVESVAVSPSDLSCVVVIIVTNIKSRGKPVE